MRALQALCVLSRFVTAEIADHVCERAFDALGKQNTHNQLRYFGEIFTLQCSRQHPAVFGKALVEQISCRNLPLQTIASLMIISGNLIVGRYKEDFLDQYSAESNDPLNINLFLAGTLPWLSSTQGFTRAIAQLLAYKLIPLVIDVDADSPEEDSNWYLRSQYRFLEENTEMKRLRNKQSKFFEGYEVDSVCTPEGVFAIPVDEGFEADPVHMVDVIKDCLEDVYNESHIDDAPAWKQLEIHASQTTNSSEQQVAVSETTDVSFQREIIPLDALNLELEGLREKRMRNAAGCKKQNLIVCASLIDKVPNLGGLARTSEIFTADRLIVPDIKVTKMDNFKSLCAGAQDWIEIEECKEQVCL